MVVRLCQLDGVILESWRTGRVPARFGMNSAERVCLSVAMTVALFAGAAAARLPFLRQCQLQLHPRFRSQGLSKLLFIFVDRGDRGSS